MSELSQGAQVQSAQGREEHTRASHGRPFISKERSLGSTAALTWVTPLVSGTVSPEMGCVDGHKPENTAPLLLQADLGLLMSRGKIAEPILANTWCSVND